DPFRAVGVVYRLLSPRKVDDRKPSHREADVVLHVESILVRPAMYDRAVHRLEQLAIHRPIRIIYKSRYPAHILKTSIVANEPARFQTPRGGSKGCGIIRSLAFLINSRSSRFSRQIVHPTAIKMNRKTCICVRCRYAVPTLP